jgi:hypothetical protein
MRGPGENFSDVILRLIKLEAGRQKDAPVAQNEKPQMLGVLGPRHATYLASAFADGDAAEITDALGVVARARDMSQLAEETGLTR